MLHRFISFNIIRGTLIVISNSILHSSQVELTVDGLYTERWITSGSFSVLASGTVFVGGSEPSYALPGITESNEQNWIGCLKKVQ